MNSSSPRSLEQALDGVGVVAPGGHRVVGHGRSGGQLDAAGGEEAAEPADQVVDDVARRPAVDRRRGGPVGGLLDQPGELPGHRLVAGGRGVGECHQSEPSASIRSIAA